MGLDLVTLAEYKAYMGTTSPTNDSNISALITKISSFVKRICVRTFVDYVDDTKVDIFRGGSNLIPSEYPVLSISSIEYSQDYGSTYTTLTEYIDYVFDTELEQIVFIADPYKTMRPMPNAFKMTFNAGYEELPPDLKLAVFDLITYYIRNDGAIHSNRNPGSNTIQIDYVTNNKLPAHIARVLDLYMADYS